MRLPGLWRKPDPPGFHVHWEAERRLPSEGDKLRADGESLRRLSTIWPGALVTEVRGSAGRQWRIELTDVPALEPLVSGGYIVRRHQLFELRLEPGYLTDAFRFFSLWPLAGPHVHRARYEVCLTPNPRVYLGPELTLAARAVPVLAEVISLREVNARDPWDYDALLWTQEVAARCPLPGSRPYVDEMSDRLDDALSDIERRLKWRRL